VLEHDNITLMGITPTYAFFSVSSLFFDVLKNQKNERKKIASLTLTLFLL
jgi:hypothetical protein